MRKRLVVLVGALALLIGTLPFVGSAASPDIARVSATSYLDLNGNENVALCDQLGEVIADVSYSGKGGQLGGNGTGELVFFLDGGYFEFQGMILINGEETFVEGGGNLLCLGSAGIAIGGFVAETEPVDNGTPIGTSTPTGFPEGLVCGNLTGTFMDGVHKNQGRISLTLTADQDACLT